MRCSNDRNKMETKKNENKSKIEIKRTRSNWLVTLYGTNSIYVYIDFDLNWRKSTISKWSTCTPKVRIIEKCQCDWY